MITGEIGAGKTTLLRALIDGLQGSDVVVGHLVTTQLGAEDTLRLVGASFGFKVKDVAIWKVKNNKIFLDQLNPENSNALESLIMETVGALPYYESPKMNPLLLLVLQHQ